MGRRIFNERQYKIHGNIVSYEDFKPFLDLNGKLEISKSLHESAVKQAETSMKENIPTLLASDYMMFKRTGNRSVYEQKYYRRRDLLVDLVIGEFIEKKGRFIDRIIDILWLILEETTWVIPAHNPDKEGTNTCLPYAFRNDADYIALFSASTGADLALIYFLLKDELDNVTTIICDRILFELETRIIKPFLDTNAQSKMWWTGVNGGLVNNWTPWIVSNVLTVCAFAVKDMDTRESIVRTALPMLDNFIKVYKSDGGCDEGPCYWSAAGGALINACDVLYDLTKGYIDIFDDELIRKMGEYEVKVYITKNRFINFADGPSKLWLGAPLVYEWGMRCNSQMMISYGKNKLNGKPHTYRLNHSQPYISLKYMCKDIVEKEDFIAPKKFYLDGIIIAGTREYESSDKGLYLAFKGGHNCENHNHNDIGNIIVFADSEPIFIDAGSGEYSRRTFSDYRYDIWSMCSEYHNVPTINGINQKAGIKYHSSDEVYDDDTGKLTIELKNAYPEEANIDTYKRSAAILNHEIIIEDNINLKDSGSVIFNYLTNIAPENFTDSSFTLRNKTITFDKSLKATVEIVDCSEVEVKVIPEIWDTENIYRIRLATKANFKNHIFTMRIK